MPAPLPEGFAYAPEEFRVKLHNDDAFWMPQKAYVTDAGYDLKARAVKREGFDFEDLSEGRDIPVWPGDLLLIMTGVFIELRPGWEAQVRSRSGLAAKHGIMVLNSPGTIDAGYRNEIGVILHRMGGIENKSAFKIKRGDRVAQMVIQALPKVEIVQTTDALDTPDRNMGGFGSTGTKG